LISFQDLLNETSLHRTNRYISFTVTKLSSFHKNFPSILQLV